MHDEQAEEERVTLADMVSLAEMAEQPADNGELERMELESRRVKIHRATRFRDRPGYVENFIEAFPVPLPLNSSSNDEAPLLDGTGSMLKYQHFSVVMSKARRLPFYVACNIDGMKSRRILRDEDSWFYDGRIDLKYQAGENLHGDNDLDRGHLVRGQLLTVIGLHPCQPPLTVRECAVYSRVFSGVPAGPGRSLKINR